MHFLVSKLPGNVSCPHRTDDSIDLFFTGETVYVGSLYFAVGYPERQCRLEEMQWEETGDGCVLFAQMRVPAGFETSEFIREARTLPGLKKVSVQ